MYDMNQLITSFAPLRDSSCSMVHWPQNVWSAGARKIKAFRTICEHTSNHSPTVSTFLPSFKKLMAIKRGSGYLDAFLCVSFHAVRPMYSVNNGSLPAWQWFHRVCWQKVFKYVSICLNDPFACFAFSSCTSQVYLLQKRRRFIKVHVFLNFSTKASSVSPFHVHIVQIYKEKWTLVADLKKHSHFEWGFSRVSLPHQCCQWMSVQNVFQVVPQSGVSYPTHFGHRERGGRIQHMDIQIWAISINLEGPPFSLGGKLILRRSLRQRNQAMRKRPILWQLSCVTRKIPARWTQHASQSHPSLRLHGRLHGLCMFGTSFPHWNSLDDMRSKMNRPSFLMCLFNNFLLTLDSRNAGKFLNLSHSLSTAASASAMFIAWGIRMVCAQDWSESKKYTLCQQYGFPNLLSRSLGCGIFVIHELRFHAHNRLMQFVVAWNCFLPLFTALLLQWRYLRRL